MSKETKTILIILGVIIILVLLVAAGYFVWKKSSEIGGAVAGTIADKIEDKTVSNASGVAESRVSEMRETARQIADELGTSPNSGWFSSWLNTDEDKIINLLNRAQSAEEMYVMKNMYENTIVPGSNFYDDLDTALQDYEFRKVKYLSALR